MFRDKAFNQFQMIANSDAQNQITVHMQHIYLLKTVQMDVAKHLCLYLQKFHKN